jgi:hypothetical protein
MTQDLKAKRLKELKEACIKIQAGIIDLESKGHKYLAVHEHIKLERIKRRIKRAEVSNGADC